MPLWAPFLRGPRSSAVRAGPCQVLVAVGSACQEPSLFFQSCPWRKPPAQMWAPRYFGITWVIAPLISSTGQISLGIAGGICFYEPLIVSLHSVCLLRFLVPIQLNRVQLPHGGSEAVEVGVTYGAAECPHLPTAACGSAPSLPSRPGRSPSAPVGRSAFSTLDADTAPLVLPAGVSKSSSAFYRILIFSCFPTEF